MQPMARNEVHICHRDSGHHKSTDCWCEPNRIYWHTNMHGITMLVVEHNDTANIHRLAHIACRERDKDIVDAPGIQWGLDAPWITRALEAVLLPEPPADPNERSI